MTQARPIRSTFKSRSARLAVLAVAAGLTASVQLSAPAAQAAEAGDAAVAGEATTTPADSLFPNQGNSGYDATHYDINLKVDVTTATANGAVGMTNLPSATATIDAVTTGAPLSSYSFDFQGSTSNLANATLNVDSVTVDGQPATFTRIENTTTSNAVTDVHKLIVTPATPVDGAFTTVVNYSGRPVAHTDTDGSSEGWNNTTDGATVINQPVGSMTLFPNNNTPRDTATYRFTVDAPSLLKTSNYANAGGKPYAAGVASNGELLSVTPNGDETRKTWVWQQTNPMASELSMLSIGRYDMYTSDITLASGRVIPEWTFIDPAISAGNQTTTLASRAQLKSVLDFYESKYGPYPGDSTGLVTDVVPSAINYALETQDRPFFPNSASRGTFYHELMHQWWGDSVAPTDWNDMSLNEGPAQYSEFQFPYEGAGSTTTTTEQQNFSLYTTRSNAGAAPWTVAPAAMGQASQLFGSQSYERGSLALEALRTSIGAATFETLMRTYQQTYGGGQISGRRVAAFESLAESLSGRDLTAFFTTWYYTSGRPAWPFRYTVNLAGPTTQVNPGDDATYTLSVRNTGKVAMTAGQAVISVDASDLLDDATLAALPTNVTLAGSTLTWRVPANGLGSTSTVNIPFTVSNGTNGNTLKAVATSTSLGGTCLVCTSNVAVGTAPISPSPVPTITGGTPTVGATLTADSSGWASDTSFDYQWLVDGIPVPGETSSTFVPTGAVVGLGVTVRVTGTLPGFNKVTQTSAATAMGVRATQPVATPTISGTPKVGRPLTVSPGSGWAPGTVFTYVWRANGVTIGGATGPTYTPGLASQVGQTLDAVVTGTKFGYTTASRTSAATAAVAAGDALVSTPAPVISGTPRVGVAFAPDYGSWDDGVNTTFQWRANGTNISGATTGSFVPTAAQLDQTLDVVVTGTKPGITAVVRTSNTSAAVEKGTQTLQPTPTITGTPRPDTASAAVPGTWDTGTTRTYQWYADGTPIAGATAIMYTPNVGQIGQALTFEVTSVRAGYTTVVRTSDAKTIIGAQVLTPTPTTSGTPQVGLALEGSPGTWDDGTTLAYQWLVDGGPIDGATAETYTPTASDLGRTLAFQVTSTRSNYEAVTRLSDPTGTVAEGVQVATPTPTITGTPKVGAELTGHPGTWDSGTSLSYQWLADAEPIQGATELTFTPGPGRVGQILTFAVTSTRTGYGTVSKVSDPTDAIAEGVQVATPTPTITGTPKVDAELTGHPGTWDSGTSLSYQWLADAEPIQGATELTFTPGPGRVGQILTFAVTGTRTGYGTVSKVSDPTDAIAQGAQVLTPTPTITGTPKVDAELTGHPGTWDSGTSLSYQWLADAEPIQGATELTFTPGPGRVGQVLTFAVTSTNTGYTTVSKVSDPTDAIAQGAQVLTPTPTISGTPKVGVELTGHPGAWDSGTSLSYQWLADGEPIQGATELTFTPGAGRVGQVLTFAVTATKTGYATVTRTSDSTDAVVAGVQVLTPTPTITGTPKVGAELTGHPGTWDSGTSLAYQWLADGQPVSGATGVTFTPGAGRVGEVLTFAVTATRTGYTTVTRTSDPTDTITQGAQVLSPTPTISGTPKVGVELTGHPGAWDSGTSLSYQWLADGQPVTGATGLTLTPGAGRVGQVLTFAVTATKTGYTTVSKVSDPTDAIAEGVQVLTPTPTISGTPRVGVELTGHPGTWDAGTSRSYQWLADGQPVNGATGLTFTPGAGRVGQVLTFAVTATRTGYTTVTRTSDPTDTISQGVQVLTPTPTISGTPVVDGPLTADPGTWDTGTTLSYRWYVDGNRVTGATGSTYTPGAAQLGRVILVSVTGTRAGYVTTTRSSPTTAPVAAAEQTLDPTPTIAGLAQVGHTLTADQGQWDLGTTQTYRWYAGDQLVVSGTASTFEVTATEVGKRVRVWVTSTKPGYTNVVRASDPTEQVSPGLQQATPRPTVTGQPIVGTTLTAVAGAWDDGVTLSYQWFVDDGQPIEGASGSTYVPVDGDVGSRLSVRVTGERPGYTAVSRVSALTAQVQAAELPVLESSVPSIVGSPEVGGSVAAEPGTWTADTAFAYQWLRDGLPIADAIQQVYGPVPADAGKTLSVRVTGAREGFTSVTEVSPAGTVALGTQVRKPEATISGKPFVGRSLTAKAAPRDAGTSVVYRWSVGTKVLARPRTKTLPLKAAWIGKKVSVKVVVRKPGYVSISDISAKVGPVRRK